MKKQENDPGTTPDEKRGIDDQGDASKTGADPDESAYPQDDLWPLEDDAQTHDIEPERARNLADKSRFGRDQKTSD